MRVLVATQAVIDSPTFVGLDGETPADTAPLPTVTATRDDGTIITPAPVVSDPQVGDGRYQATLLPADHTTRVDLVTLTWVGTVAASGQQTYTQTVEVMGGFYVSLPELRQLDGLTSATKHPTARLRALRDELQNDAERYCDQAFVPRYASEHLPGSGGRCLLLSHRYPQAVISATQVARDGTQTTLDVSGWKVLPTGELSASNTTFHCHNTYIVRYRHGRTEVPPELVEAAKEYVRAKSLERNGNRHGRDLLSETTDGITQRWSTPDWDAGRPTGLLDVDRVLNSLGKPLQGVA